MQELKFEFDTLPIFEEEDLLELIEDIPEKEVAQKTKRKKV
mgnify:FL=1